MIETILWIIGGLLVGGILIQWMEEDKLKSWSDEKLEARSRYLSARNKSDMAIWREQNRRSDEERKQRTKEEWEKYK